MGKDSITEKYRMVYARIKYRCNINSYLPELAIKPAELIYRYEAEKKYFGSQTLPSCPILKVDTDKLNSQESVDFVKKINPDVVLIYGSGLIKEPLYSTLPKNAINLHLGLSPNYKGAATLFWPFYFMEPTYAGSTFHYITDKTVCIGYIVGATGPF